MSVVEKNSENNWPFQRRNFVGGLIHALFFRLGMAFSQVTSVLLAFVFTLTGSNFWVGLLSTLQRSAVVVPQLFFANYLESRPLKKPYLLGVLYFRSLVWWILAIATFYLGVTHPGWLAGIVLILITLFFLAGGLGELIYSYLIASTISPTMRGRFMGFRALLGGIAGVLAGYGARHILAGINSRHFTTSYGMLFLLTAFSIAIAGTGFFIMREPAGHPINTRRNLKKYLKDSFALIKKHSAFKQLLRSTFLIAAMYLALPFYVVFAKVSLHITEATIGLFVTLQILGDSLGGLLWGWLGDRYGYRLVIMGISAITLLIPLWALVSGYFYPPAFAGTFALAGMVFRNIQLATRNYLFEISSERLIPTHLALKNTLTSPSLLFPLIGGGIVKVGGFEFLFGITALIAIVCIYISFNLPEPRKSTESVMDDWEE